MPPLAFVYFICKNQDFKKISQELINKGYKTDFYEKHQVMRGLQILAKYEDDVVPEFGHDVILASDFESVLRMTEEEVVQMAKLGWFYDQENSCWAHF